MKKLIALIITSLFLLGCVTIGENNDQQEGSSEIDNRQPEEKLVSSKVLSYELEAFLGGERICIYDLQSESYNSEDLTLVINDITLNGSDIQLDFIEPTSVSLTDADVAISQDHIRSINHPITENEYETDMISGEIQVVDKDRRFLTDSVYTSIHVLGLIGSFNYEYPDVGVVHRPMWRRKAIDHEEMIQIFASTFIDKPMALYLNRKAVIDPQSDNTVVQEYVEKYKNSQNAMSDRGLSILNFIKNITPTSTNINDFLTLLQENAVTSPEQIDEGFVLLMPLEKPLDLTAYGNKKVKVGLKLISPLSLVRIKSENQEFVVYPAYNDNETLIGSDIPELMFELTMAESADGVLVQTDQNSK